MKISIIQSLWIIVIISTVVITYNTFSNIRHIHVLYTTTKHSGYLLGLKTSIISLVNNLYRETRLNIYVFVAQEDRMFVDRNVLPELQDKMLIDAPTLYQVTDYLQPAIEKYQDRITLAIFGCDEPPDSLPTNLIFGNTNAEKVYSYIQDAEVLWCRYTSLDFIDSNLDIKYLIYMDSDTIITKDISFILSDVYKVEESKRKPLYAVENCKIKNKDIWNEMCEIQGNMTHMTTFCNQCSFANGVFVIDLDFWFSNDYMNKMEEMLSTLPEPYIADTAALNLLYYDKYGKLNGKFNSMGLGIGKKYPDNLAKNASILHWTGPLKWWLDDTNNHLVKKYYPEVYDPLTHQRHMFFEVNDEKNKVI